MNHQEKYFDILQSTSGRFVLYFHFCHADVSVPVIIKHSLISQWYIYLCAFTLPAWPSPQLHPVWTEEERVCTRPGQRKIVRIKLNNGNKKIFPQIGFWFWPLSLYKHVFLWPQSRERKAKMKPYGPLYSNIFNVVQSKHTHTALCYILKNIDDGNGTKKDNMHSRNTSKSMLPCFNLHFCSYFVWLFNYNFAAVSNQNNKKSTYQCSLH